MNILGNIIREKGLKKGYIAKKIGVGIPTLQRYIEGINYPGADIAKKLSEILGYSIEEIFFANNTIKVVNDKNVSGVICK